MILSLEAAGTELRIVIADRVFQLPSPTASSRAATSSTCPLSYDARRTMTDLGALYRAVEALGVQLDGPAYTGRF